MVTMTDQWKIQEALLDETVLKQTRFQPLLSRPPDKRVGDVLPTIWFGSDLVVTGVQHVMIAKMVLTAENPSTKYEALEPSPRAIETNNAQFTRWCA
jgi:hypothetical protein